MKITLAHLYEIKRGIESVRGLIDDSKGVVGLHLNGDVAEWSELEEGGRFEEWLSLFNSAERLIDELYNTYEV